MDEKMSNLHEILHGTSFTQKACNRAALRDTRGKMSKEMNLWKFLKTINLSDKNSDKNCSS